jgi:hypothetical protein
MSERSAISVRKFVPHWHVWSSKNTLCLSVSQLIRTAETCLFPCLEEVNRCCWWVQFKPWSKYLCKWVLLSSFCRALLLKEFSCPYHCILNFTNFSLPAMFLLAATLILIKVYSYWRKYVTKIKVIRFCARRIDIQVIKQVLIQKTFNFIIDSL